MKIINNITKKANEAASYTAKKAEEITNAAKLRYKLHLAETKLECTFEGIGRLYYSAVMEGDDTAEAISDLMVDVTELNSEIKEYKAAIAAGKNQKLCAACGEMITNESFYCNHCGTKVTLEAEKEKDSSDVGE